MLIDSHCHLDLPAFAADRDAVLARATAAGVGAIIVPAVDRHNWDAVLALAGERQGIRIGAALGLHPCFAHHPDDLDALSQRLATESGILAVGECGLDAVSGAAALPEQIRLCQAQLALACEHQLPVILHVRKAHNDMLSLLARQPLPAGGVVHGFSGSRVQAEQYWQRGLRLGVGGVITYPRANKTRQALAQMPVDALLLETDSPDMPLCGYQGERNEPARVASVLAVLAELRQCEPVALARQLTLNTQRLFSLPQLTSC